MGLERLVAACLVLLLCAGDVFAAVIKKDDTPSVNLGYEIHTGTLNATGDYYTFSNIPYAQQPVDNLRFALPQPIVGNSSVVTNGGRDKICYQAYPGWIIGLYQSGTGLSYLDQLKALVNAAGQTEACLLLDVRVPVSVFEKGSSAEAPVIVYIHGGGFTFGSKNSDGNPAGLIARSQADGGDPAIVVTINYRLGLFGWLAGAEGLVPNLGLYDQRMALDWVQNYIARFGGAPSRVTVMGESAGASSIVHQITAFGGLVPAPFAQAIPQSPAFQINIDFEEVFQMTTEAASAETNTTVNCVMDLKQLSSATLKSVNQAVVYPANTGSFNFGPGPDGTFVPKLPQVLLQEGAFNHDVKLLISHTSNESVPFTPTDISTASDVRQLVEQNFPEASEATVNTMLTDIWPDVLDGTYPWTTEFARAVQIGTEVSFSCITGYLGVAFGNVTHNYIFGVGTGYHAADLSYTFYNGDTSSVISAELAEEHQDYIVQFARTGNPNEDGLPEFPEYGDESTVLELTDSGFNTTIDAVRNYRCDWIQQAMVDGLI
ncbi:carboxylesterase [Xylariaceae sp. FL0016]|nr:carboxylesterase [Xylariaceae sp. FL0016]